METIRLYKQSMKKLDELTEEHGYEKARELHSYWLKTRQNSENNQRFLDRLTPKEREQFTYAFGELTT